MSDTVTGKVTRLSAPQDIDWRVEQQLARVLAERDLFWDGFLTCFYLVVIAISFIGVIWLKWDKAEI